MIKFMKFKQSDMHILSAGGYRVKIHAEGMWWYTHIHYRGNFIQELNRTCSLRRAKAVSKAWLFEQLEWLKRDLTR